MPWIQATQTLEGSGANQRRKYKSAYMKAPFPDDQIEAIHQALAEKDESNAQSLLQVDTYDCQINARQPTDTAGPQRPSIMKLHYQADWSDPGGDRLNVEWMPRFYQSVYRSTSWEPMANGVTDVCYVNDPDDDLVHWEELYSKENYPGVQAVKRRWDPHDRFHHDQSVRP